VEAEQGFGRVIVVDNLPEVEPAKYDKLLGVVSQVFQQCGEVVEGGIRMPQLPGGGTSKGFAFVEYVDVASARRAREQLEGYKLGKGHVFRTNFLDDIMRLARTPAEYETPSPPAYKPMENLQEWMMDPRGRDQYCIHYQDSVEIHWNEPKTGSKELAYKRKFWTEGYVTWSPQGNFAATLHAQGAQIWGGEKFGRIMRFMHPGVTHVDISPREKYFVTFSAPQGPQGTEVLLIVWEISTGRKLREFTGTEEQFPMGGDNEDFLWPILQWGGGGDDKYFARYARNKAGNRIVSVYETPGMNLMEKKSLAVTEGVDHFMWSPTQNVMACYIPAKEEGNIPAKVSVIEIPSRKELRQKNIFNVAGVKMYFQAQGKYLGCHVARFTKSKKSQYHGFELFRMLESGLPMEVLEPPEKALRVQDFAFEPNGDRFAVIQGDTGRPDVHFYSMVGGPSRTCKHLETLKMKSCNKLCWSPQGSYVILAGLKGLNGQFEFFNAETMETMSSGDHFMCTNVDWDPTGRYVVTSVANHQMENGYIMWNFMGDHVFKQNIEKFFLFSWRPRTGGLLPADEEAKIKKNLKQYAKRFEEEDQKIKSKADTERREAWAKLVQDWNDWEAEKAKWAEANKAELDRLEALTPQEEGDYVFEEVEVEEVVEEREVVEKEA